MMFKPHSTNFKCLLGKYEVHFLHCCAFFTFFFSVLWQVINLKFYLLRSVSYNYYHGVALIEGNLYCLLCAEAEKRLQHLEEERRRLDQELSAARRNMLLSECSKQSLEAQLKVYCLLNFYSFDKAIYC